MTEESKPNEKGKPVDEGKTDDQAPPIPEAKPLADPLGDRGKMLAIVSYITIIGWVIALIMHSNESQKSPLASFHLRQSLGIYLTAIVCWIPTLVLMFIPVIGLLIMMVVFVGVIGLWIIGLIGAANGELRPIPVIGDIYQNLLAGIR